jgi:hypothetical protein
MVNMRKGVSLKKTETRIRFDRMIGYNVNLNAVPKANHTSYGIPFVPLFRMG